MSNAAKRQRDSEELQALALDLKLAQTDTHLSRLTRQPDLQLGYNLIKIGDRPDMPAGQPSGAGTDAHGMTLSINLPLWEGRTRARIRSAQAHEEAVQQRLEDRRAHVRADLKELWLLLRNARRIVELYDLNLIPQARLALSTAEVDFREKRRSMAEFLEAQSALYAFQVAGLKARADVFKAWVDIERTVGRIPGADAHTGRETKEVRP